MEEYIEVNSFSGEKSKIRISEGILELDGRTLDLNKVSELKYGVEPIQFDMFLIGRKFVIDLSNSEGKFSIVLKSYIGFSRNKYYKVFSQILESIWQHTGVRLVSEAIERIKSGESIEVGKCTVTRDGISFDKNFISWSNLSYQKNYDRITLNNKSNYRIWTNLYYLETYNFDVLLGVLDWLYKQEGLKELE